jgi:putative tryptophan/tyrosine transport system substrate-binding protein
MLAASWPGQQHAIQSAETARIHHSFRWRSNMADRGARAAEQNANDRIPGRQHAGRHGQWIAAFTQRLRELGWIEGRTIAIDYRWAEGRNERMAEIAAEFVRAKANVIVAQGTQAALAAKNATATLPIVFTLPGDPIGSGLVASLARPGGNVTGLSSQTAELGGKRFELLREIVPGLRRLAVIINVGNPALMLDLNEVQAAARASGVDVASFEIRQTEDIAAAFATFKGAFDALYVPPDALINTNRIRINTLALVARLPTMYGARENVEAAGLISYGPNFMDLFRRAGDYVDKILRGSKPADLPVEQPTKFELVVNLVTAKALGLEVPATLLSRADEVIE